MTGEYAGNTFSGISANDASALESMRRFSYTGLTRSRQRRFRVHCHLGHTRFCTNGNRARKIVQLVPRGTYFSVFFSHDMLVQFHVDLRKPVTTLLQRKISFLDASQKYDTKNGVPTGRANRWRTMNTMIWIFHLQATQVQTFSRGSPGGQRQTAVVWILNDIQRHRAARHDVDG
ncbi:hypothetical protein Y032_0131g1664 [Ancylostoma ceylanicum]|uniref:Uncharacterized protein n=1 Tax=Ancylostoma ceylanicum TaxID=53326 RepID=A0A016T758_9BILA|nr:hypothetical protein Y032_0131g1664 [Ancylostoma ceylanicum]